MCSSDLNGAVQTSMGFPVSGSPDSGFSPNTLFGFYWFPGQTAGSTLSGSYEVGGFANSALKAASGGDWGTSVTADGSTCTSLFYETNFNQNIIAGADTGLGAGRFTAVAVPEPSTFALSALGLAALLRRRRK